MPNKKIEVELEYEPGDPVAISIGRKIVRREVDYVKIKYWGGKSRIEYKLDDNNVVNTDEIYPLEMVDPID